MLFVFLQKLKKFLVFKNEIYFIAWYEPIHLRYFHLFSYRSIQSTSFFTCMHRVEKTYLFKWFVAYRKHERMNTYILYTHNNKTPFVWRILLVRSIVAHSQFRLTSSTRHGFISHIFFFQAVDMLYNRDEGFWLFFMQQFFFVLPFEINVLIFFFE